MISWEGFGHECFLDMMTLVENFAMNYYYTCEPPWTQYVKLTHRIRERKRERTKMVRGSLRLLFLQEPLGLIEPLWQETPMGCFVVTVKRVRRFNVKRVVCTVKLSKASSAFSHGTVIQTWVLPAWHWHWCPFSSSTTKQGLGRRNLTLNMLFKDKLLICWCSM